MDADHGLVHRVGCWPDVRLDHFGQPIGHVVIQRRSGGWHRSLPGTSLRILPLLCYFASCLAIDPLALTEIVGRDHPGVGRVPAAVGEDRALPVAASALAGHAA